MSTAKPSLTLEDQFTFACHRGLECYTSCCRDVNIFLTPNDVRRMRSALGITSGEFLQKYTDTVVLPGKPLPLVQLRMDPDNQQRCFFVRPHGCIIYENRPWSCRMFPLDEHGGGGYLVTQEGSRCHGLVKGEDWRVKEWLRDQGAIACKAEDGNYESLASHEFLREVDIENEQVQAMVLMALYDLDRFRDFVFQSSFLDRFELEPEQLDAIRSEELALLDLAFAWVRFGLLGQKTLKLKEQKESA